MEASVLHFLTALFHEVKDRKHEKHEKEVRNAHANGYGSGNGYA